eukprot:gene38442-47465_t
MDLTDTDVTGKPASRARRPAKIEPGVPTSAPSAPPPVTSSPLATPTLTAGVASVTHLTEKLSDYMTAADLKKVKEAYRFSDEMHLGQVRKSGEPYISHPIAVAEICADWKLDAQAIMAALLHDVMEDQDVKKDELIERFGAPVANLVDGLSKLEKIEFQSQIEAQAENFRKMLLAMASDVRVILIKLADRLHNMRTLDVMTPAKKRRIASETMEVYVPIAHRLGLNNIYRELQEISFSHLYPLRYHVLAKAVKAARGNRREVVKKILESVKNTLAMAEIEAEVYGREKTLYGIYKKMRSKHLSFSQVLDVYGFRVVVDSFPNCYVALGTLHSLYKPMPGKFKDYIAIRKLNGYQSLHTTLIGPYGTPVEFQIRTQEMHRTAESGVAAHWLYKTGDINLSDMQQHAHAQHVHEHAMHDNALRSRSPAHGVFMDVLGVGVLITGDSGLGKSELGLELISRSHGLVADDAVEFARIAPNMIEGRCPALLQNLLEVRGLGLLDIKAIFGETAVRRKMRLKLIVHLVRRSALEEEVERLPFQFPTEDVLGLPIRKVVIPVAAGRNIAVLLEAAVRNTILQTGGREVRLAGDTAPVPVVRP